MNNRPTSYTDPFVVLQRDFVKMTDRLLSLERQLTNLSNATLNLENTLYKLIIKYENGFAKITKTRRPKPEDIEDAIEP
jgi:hypothetical protein